MHLCRYSAGIVFLDMQMAPGMSGKEAYERICRLKPGQKAVITSGYSTSDDEKETLEEGAGAFIKKPYSLSSIGKL